jgi:hypothetical protein
VCGAAFAGASRKGCASVWTRSSLGQLGRALRHSARCSAGSSNAAVGTSGELARGIVLQSTGTNRRFKTVAPAGATVAESPSATGRTSVTCARNPTSPPRARPNTVCVRGHRVGAAPTDSIGSASEVTSVHAACERSPPASRTRVASDPRWRCRRSGDCNPCHGASNR